jgi:glycosyltransferase involved in cell wall biosynthesis
VGAQMQTAGTRVLQRFAGSRGAGLPSGAPRRPPIDDPRRSAAAYDRRRVQNVSRLNRVEALIAFSTRSAEVYRELGVEQERIRVLRMNPAHVQRLRPRRRQTSEPPLRFAVLNACNSTPKGADLIVDALKLLSARQMDDRFRLSVRGWIAPHAYPALAAHPSVELDGDYRTEELDGLLDDVDVGLVPSVWEEVYGFVGVEFLAKGIPVIGNARGGIPEYVRPGETGWLNHSASATELAELMIEAIEHPREVQRLGARAVELREELITSSARQRAETYEIYGEAIGRETGTVRVEHGRGPRRP